jgi:hypothetical protein
MANFQRNGSISNAHVGKDFESKAKTFFATQGVILDKNISIEIGIEGKKKAHNFDLGNPISKIIVECKSHTWTESENIPSAKITTWNQAMYYFYAAPKGYRKIFIVLKHYSKKHKQTLAAYYLRLNDHLIPSDVEFWEYDEDTKTAQRIK